MAILCCAVKWKAQQGPKCAKHCMRKSYLWHGGWGRTQIQTVFQRRHTTQWLQISERLILSNYLKTHEWLHALFSKKKHLHKPFGSLNDKTFCSSRGLPKLCTGLFSPSDIFSLQQLHSTFCSHSAKFSTNTHTRGYAFSHGARTQNTHTHTQLVNSPAAANRWQEASGSRKKVRALLEAEGKKIHVCLDSVQMCRVFFSEDAAQLKRGW